MVNRYTGIQYFGLWLRCIVVAVGTAGAFAGWVSLMGETSVGAVVYINVTAMVDLPKINNFWPIATFISFASILIVGIIWSSVFTVIKRIRNQNPSIFGNSDLEERVEALEKKCHKE